MPTYTFLCQRDECQHLFEIFQKISDDHPAECPECHSDNPQQVITGTNFRLVGDGWFKTSGSY